MKAYFENPLALLRCFGLVLLLLASPLAQAQSSDGDATAEDDDAAGTTRMRSEAETGGNRFVLTPHKRNYFQFRYMDNDNDEAFQDLQDDDNAELDDAETEFQVSLERLCAPVGRPPPGACACADQNIGAVTDRRGSTR